MERELKKSAALETHTSSHPGKRLGTLRDGIAREKKRGTEEQRLNERNKHGETAIPPRNAGPLNVLEDKHRRLTGASPIALQIDRNLTERDFTEEHSDFSKIG